MHLLQVPVEVLAGFFLDLVGGEIDLPVQPPPAILPTVWIVRERRREEALYRHVQHSASGQSL